MNCESNWYQFAATEVATPTLYRRRLTLLSTWKRRIILPRKEVIHPQLPLRMPCYDFVPVISPAFVPLK